MASAIDCGRCVATNALDGFGVWISSGAFRTCYINKYQSFFYCGIFDLALYFRLQLGKRASSTVVFRCIANRCKVHTFLS